MHTCNSHLFLKRNIEPEVQNDTTYKKILVDYTCWAPIVKVLSPCTGGCYRKIRLPWVLSTNNQLNFNVNPFDGNE